MPSPESDIEEKAKNSTNTLTSVFFVRKKQQYSGFGFPNIIQINVSKSMMTTKSYPVDE